MKISKEKFKKMMRRGRSGARSLASGGKGTVIEGATGAVARYAGDALDKNLDAVGSRPWAKGAIMVAAGHMLKKKAKMASIGAALVGAGGYALADYWKNRSAASAATPAAAPVSAPSQTQGVYGNDGPWGPDTGLVYRSAAASV